MRSKCSLVCWILNWPFDLQSSWKFESAHLQEQRLCIRDDGNGDDNKILSLRARFEGRFAFIIYFVIQQRLSFETRIRSRTSVRLEALCGFAHFVNQSQQIDSMGRWVTQRCARFWVDVHIAQSIENEMAKLHSVCVQSMTFIVALLSSTASTHLCLGRGFLRLLAAKCRCFTHRSESMRCTQRLRLPIVLIRQTSQAKLGPMAANASSLVSLWISSAD